MSRASVSKVSKVSGGSGGSDAAEVSEVSEVSKASEKALARSYRSERALTFGAGALVLGASCVALAVGFGWLGTVRARRPVLDPIAVDWLAAHAVPARVAAIVAGLLLCAGGLGWLARSLRPEGRPDLRLDRAVGHELTVAAGALADAVRADAEAVDGVARARARAVGSAERPALRLDVTLRDGADLRRVWPDLDERVLARARESLGLEVLPAAVRLDTGTANRRRGR